MSLTTASASLDGLVSIEELSEALSSVNEDLKEAFSWKDVLVKLVIAAIAIAVVAIVLTAMSLGGFLAAVLIVFVAAIVMTLASFVITGAVNGWGTALGNAAENLIVVAAIGAVLAGATAGVGTFITQSVVPAVTSGINTAYSGISIFFTTKAYPAIVQGTKGLKDSIFYVEEQLIPRLPQLVADTYFNSSRSMEVLKETYKLASRGAISDATKELAEGSNELFLSIFGTISVVSVFDAFRKGNFFEGFKGLITPWFQGAIKAKEFLKIVEEKQDLVDNSKDDLFDYIFSEKNNEFGPFEPDHLLSLKKSENIQQTYPNQNQSLFVNSNELICPISDSSKEKGSESQKKEFDYEKITQPQSIFK